MHLTCCIRLVKSLTASGIPVAGAQYVAGVNVDNPMFDFIQHAKSVVVSSVLQGLPAMVMQHTGNTSW